VERIPQFTPLLIAYYETGDVDAVTEFIYTHCIDGLNLSD
jgi:hypothetical protein